VVKGNRIGTDPTGTQSRPNAASGVAINSAPNNAILANLISGNFGDGVAIQGSLATGDIVAGNRIGTNAAGTAVLPNSNDGVEVFGSAGGSVVESNLISGNKQDGVALRLTSAPGTVAHNLIGVSAGLGKLGNGHDGVTLASSSGNTVIGNRIWFNAIGVVLAAGQRNQIQGNNIAFSGGNGVLLSGASFNAIGGAAAGQGNTIFHNKGAGVVVNSSSNDAILGNAIFANAAGITLISGNNGQAGPSLLFATYNGVDDTTVIGTLHAAANTTYRLELFDNPAGGNQGQKFLGFILATTNAGGDVTFVADFAGAGTLITVTATDPMNNTSAFSRPVVVVHL
jgi:parallel beta-helix repeat protein